MMKSLSIDERLELAASYGEMEINLFLWKKCINRLRKNGLIVTEKFPSKRKGEIYCIISWAVERAGGENGDFTQANYLYKTAVKAVKEK